MAVVMARPERRRFASPDPLGGMSDEVREAFEGMEAYAGTYEINRGERTVKHHVAIHRFPNWEGSVQERYFSIVDDELTLRTPSMSLRGGTLTLVLVWRRLS